MFQYICPIMGAFVCSALSGGALIPSILNFCKRKHLYDEPNLRKVHKNPIPRLGGIIFLPSMVLASFIAILVMGEEDKIMLSYWTLLFFLGLLIIYSVGIVDDLVGVSAMAKLMVQLVSACLIPMAGLYINNLYGLFGLHQIPCCVGYPLTIFVFMLICNAMNLIDGIDGLSASLAVLALMGFMCCFYKVGMYVYCVLVAGLTGVLLSFLYFNLFGKVEKNRKLFMGDSGSLTLGYVLAFLFVKVQMFRPDLVTHGNISIVLSYSVILIPTFDAVRVAFRRLRIGTSLFSPDKNHIHHKLMQAGLSQHATLLAILMMQVAFVVLNVTLVLFAFSNTFVLLVDVFVYTAFHLFLSRHIRQGRESGS